MARVDNYYENRLQDKEKPAVQEQVSLDTPAQPATPAPPGYTQQEMDQNLQNAVKKSEVDAQLFEGQRSIWSRMPYEIKNTIYDMPREKEWNLLTTREQYDYIRKERAKLSWKVISAAPKQILKAPFNLGYSLLQGMTSVADKALGLSEQSLEPSINLPFLGEIKGVKGSYAEGRKMGLSPFFSAVKATGEVAGDAAITINLAEAIGAAFRPKVITVEQPVGGKDFRSLTVEQKSEINVKIKDKKLSTGEVYESTQNPNISYHTLPEYVTSKYKGNTNNTFLKVTPKGTGLAEYSIVQVRKSLVDRTKDFFSKKFGKSKIVEGEFGPEVKLESGVVRYSPAPGTQKASVPTVADRNPLDIAASNVPGIQKLASGSELHPEQMISVLQGRLQQNYKVQVAQVEQALGEIHQELTLAEAGKRILIRGEEGRGMVEGITAQRSTFPDWIPEDLRSRALLDKVMDSLEIDKLAYPTGNQTKVRRLYDAILDRVDDQTGMNTKQIREAINDNFVRMAEEKAAAKAPVIPKELRPLAEEAVKYKSAEEFVGGQITKFDDLSIPAKSAIQAEAGVKMTNFGKSAEEVDPFKTEWLKKTETLENLKVVNADVFADTFTKRGSMTKGRIIVDKDGIVIDGNNRLREAFDRGDKTIDIFEEITQETKSQLTDIYNQAIKGAKPSTEVPETVDPFARPPQAPSIMSKPLKGFENRLVTQKNIEQIIDIQADRSLSDATVQAISKVITGKDNIYELTQNEAYQVSESIRSFSDVRNEAGDDWKYIARSYTHPARYWMEAAERELGFPIYSEVFLPMETGARLLNVYAERWQNASREIFGKYSSTKFYEERRLLTDYIEGNKSVIGKNKTLDPQTKKDLIKIGDWLKTQYRELFSEVGISSDKYFSFYSPKMRKLGGIFNLYKTAEMPAEIRPFYEFERQGALVPLEDDALALFDIYTRAFGKKQFISGPLEQSKMIIEGLPRNLKVATNDYVQEKLGFQDGFAEVLNNWGKSLSKKSNGVIPEDITKQMIDLGMTNSYAGALGLPRIMPILRNAVQVLTMTYPEVGPQFFVEGAKRFYSEGGLQEVRDNGFLVKMGVPYGSDLVGESGRGVIGKSMDVYKRINVASMKPYASIDINNRGITYHAVKSRFENYWDQFSSEKINWDEFEQGINMDGFNPTLQNILREKFRAGTEKSLKEAQDLMIMDILDRTQFPYRKGSESRLHYGLKGKFGLQFAQWSWEYAFTLKSWISRGQWDKIVRWIGMSAVIKRSFEEEAGIDVSKWVAQGPFSGFPIGPVGKMAASSIGAINAGFSGMTDDLNKYYKDIFRSMKIYGGVLSGVGVQKMSKFKQSVDRYEAGISVSPDPKKPFGIYSTTGKLVRWVDFTELVQVLIGFQTEEGTALTERVGKVKKESVDYSNRVNKAMNYLVDGEFDKFSQMVEKHNLMIGDLSAKLKSYNIPLDQRVFEKMPMELKIKYFNVFYPQEGQ